MNELKKKNVIHSKQYSQAIYTASFFGVILNPILAPLKHALIVTLAQEGKDFQSSAIWLLSYVNLDIALSKSGGGGPFMCVLLLLVNE